MACGLGLELRNQMAQCHNAGKVLNCSIAKPLQHHHVIPAISTSGGVFKARLQLRKAHKCSNYASISFTKGESCHYPLVTSVRLLHWLEPNHIPFRNVSRGSGVGCKCNLSSTVTSNDDANPTPRCVVLDIEGTTTPISFVTDVLFPYARNNVGRHLYETYETQETREDIKLLRSQANGNIQTGALMQVESDLEQGVTGAIPIPSEDSGMDNVVSALVANVEAMIKADRKIPALKQLQGHIWRTGFQNNELEGVVYEDVPKALERWHKSGTKVYIYSSGSRLAQRLIFGKTAYGDLRKYLSGFFDTFIGNKRETSSYNEIYESVGVDKPSEILFITDVYQEAVAAKGAGLEVIISIRPGNAPLPQNHGFRTISSFLDI